MTDREVKKEKRDLNQQLSGVDSPLARMDLVQKKWTELLTEMKKLERDHTKSKKRTDHLQKESEKAKSENSKTAQMKERLEKLCRELTKENKKFKVRSFADLRQVSTSDSCSFAHRTRTSD
jgi:chromosome segregation ATPase